MPHVAQPAEWINMNKSKYSLRSLLLAATMIVAATATGVARTPPSNARRRVSSGFQQACTKGHSGYFAINLKLSGDGGCLEMLHR